ncbi:MAG: DUF3990 domain-containing protein [Eubacterium sp.]|nr:DUF3990 domain-containing protein [Eubacterium sp.]
MKMELYHTSSAEIKSPDVNYGRRNADFGGGFYLSDSLDFVTKWSSERNACVNRYTLNLTDLKVKHFEHSDEWFDYIANNRVGNKDKFAEYDVIIGPIANDTLYDTYGIIFSGLISGTDALKLLKVGKRYTQINVKTEKAAKQLTWESAQILTPETIASARETVKAEEAEFRNAFNTALEAIENADEIDEILG